MFTAPFCATAIINSRKGELTIAESALWWKWLSSARSINGLKSASPSSMMILAIGAVPEYLSDLKLLIIVRYIDGLRIDRSAVRLAKVYCATNSAHIAPSAMRTGPKKRSAPQQLGRPSHAL